MALAAHYDIGTASIANGATAVTGAGTSWQTASIQPDDEFVGADGRSARIASVGSNTSITLKANWPGTTQSGGGYYIRRALDGLRMQESVLALLTLLNNGTLTGLASAGSAPNKGIRWTGAGAAELIDISDAAKALLDDANAAAMLTTLGIAALGIGVNVSQLPPPNGSSVADLNEITLGGLYYANSATANVPTAHSYAVLHAPFSSANAAAQLALGVSTNAIKYRRKGSGVWQAWNTAAIS